MASHTNFEAWRKACEDAGLKGPYKRHGFEQYDYTDANGDAVANWDGTTDTGTGPGALTPEETVHE